MTDECGSRRYERQIASFRVGKDPLTQYIDTCRTNQLATFANKRSEVTDLITIDGMLRTLVDGAIDPKSFLPMGFMLRMHSAYLTAVGALMAGQLHELQALLRVCLEQAAYGHYIGNDQAIWERWMNRHESTVTLKSVRNEFTHGKISRHLAAADATLGEIYTRLYDQTIDYDAHPNERGMSMSSDIVDLEDGGTQFQTVYLYGDGLMLDYCLKVTSQVGLCALRIARVIYPTRFQAVGTQYQLDDMCRRC